MTTTSLAVEAIGVGKRYGGVIALHDVNVRVRKGSIFGLIGPNGAGKSTMFDVMCGITKPDTGTVTVLGTDVRRVEAHEAASRGIGRTFQRTAMFGESTVAENLLFASFCLMRHNVLQRLFRLEAWRRDMATYARKADEVLEICGLVQLRHQPASSLDYGTQRRLAVAIMLMNDPRIIFLDEPVAGMNDHETAAFIALMRTVAVGRTIVIVEHDMVAIGALCDEVLVMVDGRPIVNDTPERALKHPDVVTAYLGGTDDEQV